MRRFFILTLAVCMFIVPLIGCYYEEEPAEIDPYEIYEGAERSRIGGTVVADFDDYVMVDKYELYSLLDAMYAYGFMAGYANSETGTWDGATDYYMNAYDYDSLHEALASCIAY